ncbi:MAG: 2-nitropropane dioxygenase [Chloroflexi bacterium RBG_13_48_17]|nr:MAG: 2-nitropropane dioxygenase [Chloroflexi bacterium RBG_13_48_17]
MLNNFAVCDLLDIDYPIIQGGMAWLGTAELVSAVSNAGGLGVIGSGDAPTEWLLGQIRQTRERTGKPFAVNIMMMSPFLADNLKLVVAEKVGILTCGGGNPGGYLAGLKQAGIKVMPVVSSVALARRLERLGADAIIAEGMESGGHVGETTTMALVPQIASSVKVPVIAAGGIADGRGLVAALALGAQGVQMGTRFICSEECVAHPKFKEQIMQAHDRATIVTGVSTGHPVRCLENKLTYQFTALEKAGASKAELEELGKGKLSLGVVQGDIEQGSLMAGQIAGLIKEIKPVKAIIRDIMVEAQQIIDGLGKYKAKG